LIELYLERIVLIKFPGGLDQQPLAGGAVLQVDQATPSHQGLLWHQRQCRENTDLDCHLDLCVGGHRQKEIEPRSQLVLDSTDLKRDAHGETPDLTDTFAFQ
jgi:hypothetical protein